jgi:predicted transcriptional regulator
MSRISSAESLIMEALWTRGPLLAEEIVGEVAAAQGWGEATVRTLITRLLKKKAIASTREGAKVRYRPLVSRDDYLTTESQGLLDRLFGSQVAPLVAHYAKHRKVSPEELARLKRLIADLEEGEDE